MKARILVAMAGIPFLLLVLIWAPDYVTMLLVTVMCAIGAYELMHAVLGERGKPLMQPMVWLPVWAALLLPTLLYRSASQIAFLFQNPIWYDVWDVDSFPFVMESMIESVKASIVLPACLAFVFVLLLFFLAIRWYGREKQIPFAQLTAAVFAGLIFPLMLSCLIWLRLRENGAAWVFVPLCVSFGSDTFALFAGMGFGKHKLAPHVSPKKTVEGGFGGLFGGVFGMLVFKWIAEAALQTELIAYLPAILLGLVGSVIGQIGDLSFSVVKREFGVKDYGKLLPGHGGILDRFDSVAFVAPCVWICLQIFEMG